MPRINPMKPYALRKCPYCGDLISNIDKYGNRLMKSRYALRKACYKTDCRAEAMGRGKQIMKSRPMPVLNQPIDHFIYRGAKHVQN